MRAGMRRVDVAPVLVVLVRRVRYFFPGPMDFDRDFRHQTVLTSRTMSAGQQPRAVPAEWQQYFAASWLPFPAPRRSVEAWSQPATPRWAVPGRRPCGLAWSSGASRRRSCRKGRRADQRYAPRPSVPNLDPLGLLQPPSGRAHLKHFGLSEEDLDKPFGRPGLRGGRRRRESSRSGRSLERLKRTTAAHRVEFMPGEDTPPSSAWLQEAMERAEKPKAQPLSRGEAAQSWGASADAETAWRTTFLHRKYCKKAGSLLEGAESLNPAARLALIENSGARAARDSWWGLAHRGRLNVLVNVSAMRPTQLLPKFRGTPEMNRMMGTAGREVPTSATQATASCPMDGTLHLRWRSNPATWRLVDPVVEGRVRAQQDSHAELGGRAGPRDPDRRKVLPSDPRRRRFRRARHRRPKCCTSRPSRATAAAGTIHVIINNQVGFTTNLGRRSTPYATDIAACCARPCSTSRGGSGGSVWAVQSPSITASSSQQDVLIGPCTPTRSTAKRRRTSPLHAAAHVE